MRNELAGLLVVLATAAMVWLFGFAVGNAVAHGDLGSKWGYCYPNKTCDANLSCLDMRCVQMPDQCVDPLP